VCFGGELRSVGLRPSDFTFQTVNGGDGADPPGFLERLGGLGLVERTRHGLLFDKQAAFLIPSCRFLSRCSLFDNSVAVCASSVNCSVRQEIHTFLHIVAARRSRATLAPTRSGAAVRDRGQRVCRSLHDGNHCVGSLVCCWAATSDSMRSHGFVNKYVRSFLIVHQQFAELRTHRGCYRQALNFMSFAGVR
jgi:hypothetical protein